MYEYIGTTGSYRSVRSRRTITTPPRVAVPSLLRRSGAEAALLEIQRQLGNGYVQRMVGAIPLEGEEAHAPAGLERAIRSAGSTGQALPDAIRAQMEPTFSHDFSGVRVHTGAQADGLSRALSARAFTTGPHIFFRDGECNPGTQGGRELLAHELTHVVQQAGAPLQPQLKISQPGDPYEREADLTARLVVRRLEGQPSTTGTGTQLPGGSREGKQSPGIEIQRDLARQPPGRVAEPPALTEEQVDAAIRYNEARYSERSIRLIQDVIGATATGVMDAETVHMIVEWQADFRLDIDGKIGLRTLRTIARELISEGERNSVIRLIIDGHNMPTAGLNSIRFDSALTDSNAVTAGPIPGNSTVRIGPPAFAQGYEGLVHTIRHELEHVQQRRAGMANQNLREFLAEATEIMSVGMLTESLAGFMDDAGRALHHWNLLPAAERTANRDRFAEVRRRVRRRFNAASAAQQATHQATMNAYDAVVLP